MHIKSEPTKKGGNINMLEELLNTFRQLTVEDIPFLIFMTAVFFGTLTLVFRMFGIEHPLLIPIVLILDLFCEINTWFEKRRKKKRKRKECNSDSQTAPSREQKEKLPTIQGCKYPDLTRMVFQVDRALAENKKISGFQDLSWEKTYRPCFVQLCSRKLTEEQEAMAKSLLRQILDHVYDPEESKEQLDTELTLGSLQQMLSLNLYKQDTAD